MKYQRLTTSITNFFNICNVCRIIYTGSNLGIPIHKYDDLLNSLNHLLLNYLALNLNLKGNKSKTIIIGIDY